MLSLFPRGVLDEIWELIGSISESFLSTLVLGNRGFLILDPLPDNMLSVL